MSVDAEAPPKRSFWSFFTAPFRASLAARAAMVMWLFLVVLVIVATLMFSRNPAHVPWRHAMSWTRIAAILVLTFLVPFVLYWALRAWAASYRSRFPDIDQAWSAGVRALEQNGLSLQSTPTFVILGPPSPELESAMMDACGREFTVRGVPEGPAPLHWYANAEAIYVVCSETGWLSRVNRSVYRRSLRTDEDSETGVAELP